MKVLLVDDHPLFIEGLKNMLTARGVDVVGTAHDGLEGLEKARALHPDVVLMDIRMPHLDGLASLRLVRDELPDTKVVMLTMCDDDDELFTAIRNGASGYFLKTQDTDAFFLQLQNLANGDMPLAPGLAGRILREYGRLAGKDSDVGEEEGLTGRQTEVLALVAQGFTYKEVGAKLRVAERTIKYHMGEIVQRLHVKNRKQAVAHAHETGLGAAAGSRQRETD